MKVSERIAQLGKFELDITAKPIMSEEEMDVNHLVTRFPGNVIARLKGGFEAILDEAIIDRGDTIGMGHQAQQFFETELSEEGARELRGKFVDFETHVIYDLENGLQYQFDMPHRHYFR